MKITQIMLSDGWGGAERLFVELCLGLAAEGVEVQAICRNSFDRGRDILHGKTGIRYETVSALGNWDLYSYLRIKRAIADFSPQAIHTHLIRSTLMGGRGGRVLGIPTVTTTHNRIKTKYLKNIDYFTTITTSLSEYLVSEGISSHRIRQIPNFSLFTPVKSPASILRHPPVYVSLGRFVPKKGYRFLIEAFARCVEEFGSDSRLLIGGSGPEETTLREMVRNAGLERQVLFAGWVENTEEFLLQGDIFVLPSLDEPFGIVLLEAMAKGKPIVATRTGGPLDLLDDSTAYLVNPGDVDSLTQGLLEAARDHAGRHSKAETALRLYRDHFTREAIIPRFIDLYRTISENLSSSHMKI